MRFPVSVLRTRSVCDRLEAHFTTECRKGRDEAGGKCAGPHVSVLGSPHYGHGWNSRVLSQPELLQLCRTGSQRKDRPHVLRSQLHCPDKTSVPPPLFGTVLPAVYGFLLFTFQLLIHTSRFVPSHHRHFKKHSGLGSPPIHIPPQTADWVRVLRQMSHCEKIGSVFLNFHATNKHISQSQWLCGEDVTSISIEATIKAAKFVILWTSRTQTTRGKVSQISQAG